jgi:hypothetical protein
MRGLIPDPHAERQHAAEAEAQEVIKAIEESESKHGAKP